jgi:hypothetical protein
MVLQNPGGISQLLAEAGVGVHRRREPRFSAGA